MNRATDKPLTIENILKIEKIFFFGINISILLGTRKYETQIKFFQIATYMLRIIVVKKIVSCLHKSCFVSQNILVSFLNILVTLGH